MEKRIQTRAPVFGGLAAGLWAFGLLTFLHLGWSSEAQALDDGGCVYNREVYVEGTVMCQGSQKLRCDAGAWGQIGICHGEEAFPEPITSGGDRDEPEGLVDEVSDPGSSMIR